MWICADCGTRLDGDQGLCPACGSSGVRREPIGTALPDHAAAEDDDREELHKIPAALGWRVRTMQARSPFSERAVRLGFIVGVAVHLLIAAAFVPFRGGTEGLTGGCMLIFVTPLTALMFGLAFGVAALLSQAASQAVRYAVDPEWRRTLLAVERLKADPCSELNLDNNGDKGAVEADGETAPHDANITQPGEEIRP